MATIWYAGYDGTEYPQEVEDTMPEATEQPTARLYTESIRRFWQSQEAEYAREVRRLEGLRQRVYDPDLKRSLGVRLYHARRKLDGCRLYLAEMEAK